MNVRIWGYNSAFFPHISEYVRIKTTDFACASVLSAYERKVRGNSENYNCKNFQIIDILFSSSSTMLLKTYDSIAFYTGKILPEVSGIFLESRYSIKVRDSKERVSACD